MVAIDQSKDQLIAGYGTWTYVEAFGTEPVTRHLEIAWFGIDKRYQGVTDPADRKMADLVFASVEGRAFAGGQSNEDMPVTLICHVDNFRGRQFWERQGFRLVGPPYAEVEEDRYHRMVR